MWLLGMVKAANHMLDITDLNIIIAIHFVKIKHLEKIVYFNSGASFYFFFNFSHNFFWNYFALYIYNSSEKIALA